MPGDCISIHKHHKAVNTCDHQEDSDEYCQSETRRDDNSRRYTKKTDSHSEDEETWSNVPINQKSDCLRYRIASYLPWWSKDSGQKKSRSPETCFSRCRLTNVRDQRKPPSSHCYSDGEDIIQVKKQMIESEERARKYEKLKIKHRKETYKRYKMKAKEIEKQVKIIEKEKMKNKQKALREIHRIEQEKLKRERQLLREKAKLDRLELINRQKNGKHHIKSLKRKLRAKCEYIYYDSDGPSDELSESSLERIPQYGKSNKPTRSKRSDKRYHSYSRSKEHARQRDHSYRRSKEHTRQSNQAICGEHTCSDEEVARILNALLDTNVQFDPKLINKIKTLLKNNTKIQGYFDEYRRNNLTHQLKCKLFSRITPDSKLKFFLNSKKKLNLSNEESRELVRCILEQINGTEGQMSSGDTALEKICNVLWKPSSNLSNTSLSEQQNELVTQDKQTPVTTNKATSRKIRKKNKTRKRTKSQKKEMFKKFTRKERKSKARDNSVRTVNSIDLTKKKLSDHSKRKKKQGSQRHSRLRQSAQRYIRRLKGVSKSRTRSPQDKPSPLDKAYNTQTDSNRELEKSDKEECKSPLPNLPRFTLWNYFSKPQSENKVPTDKSYKVDKCVVCEIKCDLCDNAIETDNDLDMVEDEHDDEEEQNKQPSQFQNDSDPDTNQDINNVARRTAKFWMLFNPNWDPNSAQRSEQKRKTVWTDTKK